MPANQARSEAGLCLTPGGGLQRFNLRSQVNTQEAAVWQEYKRETGLFLICCQKGVCCEKWPCEGTLFTSTQGKKYGIYQGLNDELIIRMAIYSLWWDTFLSTAAFCQFPVKIHQMLKPEATYILCSILIPEISAFFKMKPLRCSQVKETQILISSGVTVYSLSEPWLLELVHLFLSVALKRGLCPAPCGAHKHFRPLCVTLTVRISEMKQVWTQHRSLEDVHRFDVSAPCV